MKVTAIFKQIKAKASIEVEDELERAPILWESLLMLPKTFDRKNFTYDTFMTAIANYADKQGYEVEFHEEGEIQFYEM